MKETIESITEQREGLDTLKKAIATLPNSRGKALAYTALELGRMYMGEICRELGKKYPYEATKQATTAAGIQEAVDTSNTTLELGTNEIVNLNILRDKLDAELPNFLTVIETIQGLKGIERFKMDCAVSEAYRGLKEARMWLGIRLGELRDTETAKS